MNNDINKYYLSLIQEISTRQLSNEDGDNQEQTFTRYVFDVLSEAGETENATVAFDEKDLGTKKQHKIMPLFLRMVSIKANFLPM